MFSFSLKEFNVLMSSVSLIYWSQGLQLKVGCDKSHPCLVPDLIQILSVFQPDICCAPNIL
jgi:hypothetical protein